MQCNKIHGLISLIFFIFVIPHTCFAGDTLAHHFPSAVLVQLRSEQNRLQAMEKAHDYKKLEEAEKDALGVRQAMVNDFKDHFNYCPVYYYIDTNLALIKNREFDGVLLDADGTPAKNIVINSTSTDYMIVYYGSPASQPRYKTTVTDSVRYTYNSGEPIAKGLVINNYKFRQVSYLYRLGFNNFFFTNNSKHSKNAYESKHFDMEYFPTASRFNEFIWQSDRVPIRAVGGGIDTVSYQ